MSLKMKFGNDNRRITLKPPSFAALMDAVVRSFAVVTPTVTFIDDEGDLCSITNDAELREAFDCCAGRALTITLSGGVAVDDPCQKEEKEKEKNESAATAADALPKATVVSPTVIVPANAVRVVVPRNSVSIVQKGRSDRDTNWREAGSTTSSFRVRKKDTTGNSNKSWKAAAGRRFGCDEYEFGDVARTFINQLTNPESDVSRSLATANRLAKGAFDQGSKMIQATPVHANFQKFVDEINRESNRVWRGEGPYSVYHDNIRKFSLSAHANAVKLAKSESPYDWQLLLQKGAVSAKVLMACARKEATRLQAKFMNVSRKDINKVYQEGLLAVRKMAELDWKLEVKKAAKEAKDMMKQAKKTADSLVKKAKRKGEKAKKMLSNGAEEDPAFDSSSDENDAGVEAAMKLSGDMKQKAKMNKEASLREARTKATHRRQATVKKARKELEVVKQTMLAVAKKESKELRRIVLDGAKIEAQKLQKVAQAGGAPQATALKEILPPAPPAYDRVGVASVPSSVLASSAPFRFEAELALLQSMGFENKELVKDLLVQHKGNVRDVCTAMLP